MKNKKTDWKEQKEQITIVLAVYNPKEEWLKALLKSLNQQSYQNLELLVCDDASRGNVFLKTVQMIKEYITNFPFRILRNKENIGSNQTFLRLISAASGDYIAFCDQDDIWMEHKIKYLYDALKAKEAVLAYCDMGIIDKNGKQVGRSLKEKRKRLNYIEGENLAQNYIFRNCTAGCSMLLNRDCALMAKTIPDGTYWDHWLCILASIKGKVVFVKQKLVYYRIHGENQSGILAGVSNWEDYYQERVLGLYRRVMILHERGYQYKRKQEIEAVVCARKDRNIKIMWKYRYLCRREVFFEIIISRMPQMIVQLALLILRKG